MSRGSILPARPDSRYFRAGDYVVSPCGFSGRVTRVQEGVVYAEYRGEKGLVTYGIYRPEWFKEYGDLLKKVVAPPKRG